MAARSKYVAPRTVENNQQVSKALRDIQEALDALSQGTYVLGLKTTDFSPTAPSFTRVSPPTGGVRVVLPRPAPENAGLPIIFAIENPQGSLVVFASNGTKVNNAATATFTTAGIVTLFSNGVDQWSSTAQLPAGTPTSPVNDAGYVLATSNSILTNARVMANSPTIALALGTAGSVAWNWLGLSASAGTTNGQFTSMRWSNANNVSFGLDTNGVITASATVASTQASIRISAGTNNLLQSSFTFANTGGVVFGMNAGGVITANQGTAISGVTGGTLGFGGLLTGLSFSDANNVSWTLSTNAGTPGAGFVLASASDVRLGLVSHIGGQSVANITRLAFSDASNVSWSLSTAAGGATVIASVAAGGGGGIAIAASGVTATSGTVVFTNNTVVTGAASLESVQNVVFGLTGQTMGATAMFAVNNGTNSTQSNADRVTKIHFLDNDRVIWGQVTTNDANGRLVVMQCTLPGAIQRVIAGAGDFSNNTILSFVDSNGISFGNSDVGSVNVITASYNPLFVTGVVEAGAGFVSAGSLVLRQRTTPGDARSFLGVQPIISQSTFQFHYDPPRIQGFGQWNRVTGGSSMEASRLHSRAFFFQPMFGEQLVFPGRGDDLAACDWNIGHFGVTATSQWTAGANVSLTYLLGLYSVENGTGSRLSLVNSQSFTMSRTLGSATSQAFGALAGSRMLNFSQGAWSTNANLSHGEWMLGLILICNTSNETRYGLNGNTQGMPNYSGFVGQNGSSLARGNAFCGFHTATTLTALPVTVLSAHISGTGTQISANSGSYVPIVSIHALQNANFG